MRREAPLPYIPTRWESIEDSGMFSDVESLTLSVFPLLIISFFNSSLNFRVLELHCSIQIRLFVPPASRRCEPYNFACIGYGRH